MGVVMSGVKAGTIRILVVEDDPAMRESLRQLLERSGWDTEGAEDGLEALTCLQHGRFDVIVTDVHMPRMDGVALLREVRRMEDPLPVVIQTTLLDPSLEDLLRYAGAFRVLMKGGPVGDLLRSIKEACLASHRPPV
jgi:CheY-like chemotaxis protein